MDENYDKPFQFRLGSLFWLMAAVGLVIGLWQFGPLEIVYDEHGAAHPKFATVLVAALPPALFALIAACRVVRYALNFFSGILQRLKRPHFRKSLRVAKGQPNRGTTNWDGKDV
jgi:hypothetical protein